MCISRLEIVVAGNPHGNLNNFEPRERRKHESSCLDFGNKNRSGTKKWLTQGKRGMDKLSAGSEDDRKLRKTAPWTRGQQCPKTGGSSRVVRDPSTSTQPRVAKCICNGACTASLTPSLDWILMWAKYRYFYFYEIKKVFARIGI